MMVELTSLLRALCTGSPSNLPVVSASVPVADGLLKLDVVLSWIDTSENPATQQPSNPATPLIAKEIRNMLYSYRAKYPSFEHCGPGHSPVYTDLLFASAKTSSGLYQKWSACQRLPPERTEAWD